MLRPLLILPMLFAILLCFATQANAQPKNCTTCEATIPIITPVANPPGFVQDCECGPCKCDVCECTLTLKAEANCCTQRHRHQTQAARSDPRFVLHADGDDSDRTGRDHGDDHRTMMLCRRT